MNEDRCRHKWLTFMGALNKKGYYVTSFDGNNNYDFIEVICPIFDGLEPHIQGWVRVDIAISLKDNSLRIGDGNVELFENTHSMPVWIINETVNQLKEFVNKELPNHI